MLTKHPNLRLGVYMLSLLGAVAAPILAVTYPEYGAAVTTAAGVLAAAAAGVASTNLSEQKGAHEAP